jgi:hypothetical protein
MDEERSPGGSPIERHEPRDRAFKPAGGDPELIDALTAHVQRHLGDEGDVFHELVSDVVHIDVLRNGPTDDFPLHTLMTIDLLDAADVSELLDPDRPSVVPRNR